MLTAEFNTLMEDVKGIKQSVNKIDKLVDGFKKLKQENTTLKKRIKTLEEENGAVTR